MEEEVDARPVRSRSRSRNVAETISPMNMDDDRAADVKDTNANKFSGVRGNGNPEGAEERAEDAVQLLPVGHESRHNPRPMTSLLFQEPVLPSTHAATGDDDGNGERGQMDSRDRRHNDSESQEPQEERRSRRTRSRRMKQVQGRGDEDADQTTRTFESQDDIDDAQTTKARRARRTREHRDEDFDNDEEQASGRSRRSRRLNAEERRAAGEVEHIEEDLEYDNISYRPITEEPDEQETSVRSRRRRRSRYEQDDSSDERDHDGERSSEHEDDDSHSQSRGRRRAEDDEEGSTLTRRRRRRRSGKNDDQHEERSSVRRSRKQQYIDEITDVEGSTRLEAKKQRRRDNRRERSRQSQLMEQDFLARRENVDRLMVVREREHHTQISVIEDNVLVEHYVSDIQEVATVGNIYLGRVQNVLPSMEAAFVDIGQARNGVLYAGEVNWDAARLEGQPRRIELAFKSGDPVLVQVTKDPIGHKGARLTSQVTLAGRFLVLVPSGGMTGVSRKLPERERGRLKSIVSKIAPKDMGVIIRTAAEGASEEALVKDLETLVHQWERIISKRDEFLHGRRPKLLQGEPDVAIRVVRDIFNDDFSKMIVEGDKVYDRIEEYLDSMAPDLRDKLERWDPSEHEGKDVFDKWQIDSQLRKGMERQVYLPSGGSIVIDRTEAMTTIDVNTGRFIGKGKSLEETVTRCNLEASEEIARQLRLRDIGGMVMIDYVDMVMPANRDLVLRRLVECLARDRTKHQVAEVTSLGLVQMTRKRIGQGLVEAFSEECPTCKGRGFILHDEPTISAQYDDPYAMKGGDPFIKTNKHGHGIVEVQTPQGSSPDVKAKLAQIAAAAVAANATDLSD
jgi:ribonuclease E